MGTARPVFGVDVPCPTCSLLTKRGRVIRGWTWWPTNGGWSKRTCPTCNGKGIVHHE